MSGVIVPGVGHFGATRALDADWIAAILQRVGEGRPILGICLGMQWLFEGSDEAPDCPGLGILGGKCYRLGEFRLPPSRAKRASASLAEAFSGDGKPDATDLETDSGGVRLQPDPLVKIPHVGWNSLALQRDASIVEGVPTGSQVYFTHSYVAPITSDTIAITEHGEPFAAVVQHGQVAGVQFHPEKSGEVGLQVLRNFVQLAG